MAHSEGRVQDDSEFPPWLPAWIARLDYGLAVPLLARLPRAWSEPLVRLRGQLHAAWDLDWRTLSLGRRYVRPATQQGMQALAQLQGHGGDGELVQRLVRERYVCVAREEVDSLRLKRLDFDRLDCEFIGLEGLLAAQRQGQGVLLAKAHHDSIYIGLGALVHAGVALHLMATRVVFDARVPPAVQAHYASKWVGLNRILAPGHLAFIEDGLGFFVKALRQGQAVAIACDGPSSTPQRASPVDFLGRRLLMSSGLEFLARVTRSPIAFYSCQELPGQRFRVTVTPPVLLEDGGLQKAYDALQQMLLARPGPWWAADQYAGYIDAPQPTVDAQDGEGVPC